MTSKLLSARQAR
jgi:hypothetical protein